MTIDDILKLVDAGFTAQQIAEMTKAAQAAPPAEAAPAPEAPAEPAEPQAAPEDDIYTKLAAQLDAKFTELAESLRMPANPSIQDIKPLGLDDIVRNFFKEQ